MANYMAVSRTNYFRVTDEEKYEKLFSGLCSEDEINDFSCKDEDGTVWHGFGCYGSIEYCDPDDDDADYSFDGFAKGLQEILPEDEAFMLFESGYEKLRYVTGWTVVVTKDRYEYMDIQRWAVGKAKEILGEDFETQVDY